MIVLNAHHKNYSPHYNTCEGDTIIHPALQMKTLSFKEDGWSAQGHRAATHEPGLEKGLEICH